MPKLWYTLIMKITSLAAEAERMNLWPEGKMPDAQPHQIAEMTDVAMAPGFNPDQHRDPYLAWFETPPPEKYLKKCMILISGGGYSNCCDVELLVGWRKVFQELGFQVVNLVYRTPRSEGIPYFQAAWDDGQRAVRLVRSQARRFGFDPEQIGAISMSAGSHLNTMLSTSSLTRAYGRIDEVDDIPGHLNWSIAFSVAYGTTDGYACQNTRMGDDVDVTVAKEFKFDEKTCPMCLCHGGDDPWSPMSSTLVYRELRKLKIPAELHLYPDKPHGCFGFERSVEFLRQMGILGKLEDEVGILERFPGDEARGRYEKEDVWPEGKIPDFQDHQCEPYLEWHFPKEQKTKAIQIIFSGGGYEFSVPDFEEVAAPRRYLNEKGMTVVTLKYRAPRPKAPLAKHTTAWQDLQRAIRIVRSRAASFGLDPERIGIMGSSAGGHLALLGAASSRHRVYMPIDEIDSIPCKVQWAVAIYPAYVLTDGINGGNEHGGNEDGDRIAPEFTFDPDTPPILFVHGDADMYSAMGSVKCWEHLRRMGIQGGLHTLATRPHTFQFRAAPGTGSYTFLDRIQEFLEDKKLNI